ncbi:MAG: adenylosuccinate lyase [Saprospiraceae bacterium]|nr:adenylosuccinate lyase [Saprospiraceae bacterium]
MLKAISPIDGRYASKTSELKDYFSEYALIRYRVLVEIEYLISLNDLGLPQLDLSEDQKSELRAIVENFDENQAREIKSIEVTTNHDVKAVEYFIKERLKEKGITDCLEFVHFALTSQDINNTALPLLIKKASEQVMWPTLKHLIEVLESKAYDWLNQPMLARTHGQPASPTTLGKEFMVFIERLKDQVIALECIQLKAKFGGATGQFNAHVAAYPDVNWVSFANDFIDRLGLKRSVWTTQIGHYDDHSEIFHAWIRINTILIDMCRDIWNYVAMNYFVQKTVANEVGSSAMPHKVNPIDFENAEGNLGLSNAIFDHLALKLPISRLQRDLTDSTVSRNIGIPFAHSLLAMKSIMKGLHKLVVNEQKINKDLDENWAVVAEAIQTILRREGFPKPYEALKELTRGQKNIDEETIKAFIDNLDITKKLKSEMRKITPHNYIGTLRRESK